MNIRNVPFASNYQDIPWTVKLSSAVTISTGSAMKVATTSLASAVLAIIIG